jgi:hypothetical protein
MSIDAAVPDDRRGVAASAASPMLDRIARPV